MKLCLTHKLKNLSFPLLFRHWEYFAAGSSIGNSIVKAHSQLHIGQQIRNLHTRNFVQSVTASNRSLYLLSDDGCIRRHNSLSSQCPGFAFYHTFEGQPRSWLFVSHAVAGAYGAQVNVDLDLDKKLSPDSVTSLQRNIEAREVSFNLSDLEDHYQQLKNFQSSQQSLYERKHEILRLLKEDLDKDQKASLAAELRQNKKDAKSLMKLLWEFEEKVILAALQLPNDLHPDTALQGMEVTKEVNTNNGGEGDLTHIEIAKKYDLIKFSNVGPKAYYLKWKLAKAEMLLTDVAKAYFQHHGYRLMSGPEFFKSPVMEGCGLDVSDTDKVLTIQHSSPDVEPLLHLAGVSPMTFVAYVSRMNIGDASLPLRMYSLGRRYQTGKLPGLFGASQSSQVELFSCVSREEVEAEFNHMAKTVWDFLESFGFHIRLCNVSAKELQRAERRRVEIQAFAASLDDFVPIAWISDFGDFVSRRLMSFHSDNHGDIRSGKPLHMVSGTALNITSLLAIWMERSYNSSDEFILHELPLPRQSSDSKEIH